VNTQRGSFTPATIFDLIERDSWTKSGLLGKLKAPTTASASTTSSGTSNMKSWSSLNERMAIVWCHKAASKTILWGSGLVISGTHVTSASFDLNERIV
jgi:hypothetical protein